ncbi:MAG: hypothetical protein IJD75_03820, partial [Clostridia bacterium]|nr:hypothetical protein [Clostridia bacterium]
ATAFEGENYYLGTYKDFNTVSASKTSYISAENTGVSQFPAGLVSIEVVSDTPDTPETPDTPDTPATPDEPEVTEPEGTTPVEPETPDEPATGAVKDVLAIAGSTGTVSADGETISWEVANANVVVYKNEQTNAFRTQDTNHFRCYAKTKFTVTAKDGKTIDKLVITCVSSYAAPLADSASAAGYTVTNDGLVYTIVINGASVEWVNTAQMRFTTIEIIYA